MLFNFIALGFSAPYIMIAYFPNVVRFIPKSGPWLAKFKLFITLALTLTLIWLLYIFHGQIGAMALIGLVGILVLIKGLIESENKFLNIKFIQISLFIMLSSAALYFPAQLSARYAIYDQYKDSLWQNFTRQALQDALNQNKVVFVDITADWCGTCKYNKAMVLDRSWTVNMLASKKVVALRGSLNVANYQASRFMQEAGAHMIPFNIVYGPGAPNGITLPVIYSYNDLKDAVMKASDK